MATTATPTRPDPFALNEEERSVRDTAREFAQRELAPTYTVYAGAKIGRASCRERVLTGV